MEKKTTTGFKNYEPPKMEMFELMPEGVLCMSGQGTDTNNDYDFGERF